jgi:hypothetical protein
MLAHLRGRRVLRVLKVVRVLRVLGCKVLRLQGA